MVAGTSARRRDAVVNRDKLLAAGGQVFAERGLDAPLDEVARRAGVSIGTLYNHFPSREALFDAIYPARLAGFVQSGAAALAEPDPWTGFAGFLVAIFQAQSGDRGLNDAMTMRYQAAPALTEACERGFAHLTAIVERAQNAGQLRADVTIADLACIVWATSRIIATTADVAPAAWRRYLDLQLDGLRPEAAHPSEVPAMTAEQVAAAMQR